MFATFRGADLVPVGGNGADFFGLTNPVVQNLIQSCPGSKKCPGYKWIKFEINKAETNENMVVGRNDPTISIEAFHKLYFQAKAGRTVFPSCLLYVYVFHSTSFINPEIHKMQCDIQTLITIEYIEQI